MAVGFGPVDAKKVNSTFEIVKSDGTVIAQCATKQEADEKIKDLSQTVNEQLKIKEHRLI